jgi:hypothetical protein
MATEVVTRTWCDWHLMEKDQHEPGATWTIQVAEPGAKPQHRTIDLCEPCSDTWLAPMLDVLKHSRAVKPGQQPAAPKKTPAPTPPGVPAGRELAGPAPRPEPEPGMLACPLCDFVTEEHRDTDTRPSQGRVRLGGHGRRAHDTTLGALLGDPEPFTCPECGDTFSTPQGLGVHRSKSTDDVHRAAQAARG